MRVKLSQAFLLPSDRQARVGSGAAPRGGWGQAPDASAPHRRVDAGLELAFPCSYVVTRTSPSGFGGAVECTLPVSLVTEACSCRCRLGALIAWGCGFPREVIRPRAPLAMIGDERQSAACREGRALAWGLLTSLPVTLDKSVTLTKAKGQSRVLQSVRRSGTFETHWWRRLNVQSEDGSG